MLIGGFADVWLLWIGFKKFVIIKIFVARC